MTFSTPLECNGENISGPMSASRRVESYWTRSTLTEKDSGRHAATVLLHSGVFKDSYPSYPADKLT